MGEAGKGGGKERSVVVLTRFSQRTCLSWHAERWPCACGHDPHGPAPVAQGPQLWRRHKNDENRPQGQESTFT